MRTVILSLLLSVRLLATTPDEVIDFWFGDDDGPHVELWFGGAEETDQEIEARFGDLVEQAAAGELNAWAETPRGRLAMILLLDQFPRNIYRGDARAFSYDRRALGLALGLIAVGRDRELTPHQRVFVYIPLEHSESEEMQALSLYCFDRLLAEHETPFVVQAHSYALRHKETIDRFGRFPYRNEALGRHSTAEEEAFLANMR